MLRALVVAVFGFVGCAQAAEITISTQPAPVSACAPIPWTSKLGQLDVAFSANLISGVFKEISKYGNLGVSGGVQFSQVAQAALVSQILEGMFDIYHCRAHEYLAAHGGTAEDRAALDVARLQLSTALGDAALLALLRDLEQWRKLGREYQDLRRPDGARKLDAAIARAGLGPATQITDFVKVVEVRGWTRTTLSAAATTDGCVGVMLASLLRNAGPLLTAAYESRQIYRDMIDGSNDLGAAIALIRLRNQIVPILTASTLVSKDLDLLDGKEADGKAAPDAARAAGNKAREVLVAGQARCTDRATALVVQ